MLLSIFRSLLHFPHARKLEQLALALAAMAAALCGAQAPSTSDAQNPATAPEPPVAFTTPAPLPPPVPVGVPIPNQPPVDIALVLPLETPAYARAADAVRAGFMAAAEAAGATKRVLVIAHHEDGVIAAFDAAKQRGAAVIVGPLVRDDLKTLSIAGGDWPIAIALNQLDDGTPLPPNMYSLALTVESDARVLARRAILDGAKTADVLEGDGPLMRRLARAFASEWIAAGGTAPDVFALQPSSESLTDVRKALLRATPDAVLLALDSDGAALVKPFLPNVTAYASSLVFERPLATAVRDLDDIRVVDIPWILTPDAPQLAALPHRDFGSPALARLYALGLDAFRVAQAFVPGVPASLEFDGAIGHLTLDAHHQFQREGIVGIYRDGQVFPLPVAR